MTVMKHPRLPTTEAVVTAIRDVAGEHGLELSVTDDIGADQTSRHTSAESFTVLDPDDSMPHEAYVELGGVPSVTVQVYQEDDVKITVESVEFEDVPRDSVPAFLRTVYGGHAYTRGQTVPPGHWLIVPVSAKETYKEMVLNLALTPWLVRNARR